MRTLVRMIAASALSLLLLVPLGAFYGAANLPVYHSWGLLHGSFTTAIPALTAASFVALGVIPWFGRSPDPMERLIACSSVIVLVTALFYADQKSLHALSVWHLVIYAVVFAIFAVLCFRARQPALIPLFLLVPLLIDPLFGLLLTGAFDITMSLKLFGDDVLFKLLPAAVASGLPLLVIRFARRSEA